MDLIPANVCGAKTSSGAPCKRFCAPGFKRCNLHGGHTPLARQAAAETLARCAMPAATALFEIVDGYLRVRCDKCGMPTGDAGPVIRAAQIVLDRTGFPAGLNVNVTANPQTPPWAELLPWIPDDRLELMHAWLTEAAQAKEREAYGAAIDVDAITEPTE